MSTPKKRFELKEVLRLIKDGLTKKEIRKKLNISKTNLAYYLGKLEKQGHIRRKGKYLIEVLPSSKSTHRVTTNQVQKRLNKRGHAYNVKVLFPMEKNLLSKDKVRSDFKAGKLTRLSFGSMKLFKNKCSVWINKNSLTLYSNNSYYSNNALHSKFKALQDIDNLIRELKQYYGFTGVYGIEVFREHYGLIFNKFAEWYNKQKRKLYVKNEGNKAIIWVDNSRKDDIGLNEFEVNTPLRANSADDYFKSQEATGWKVTPEFVLNVTAQNAQNLGNYAKHLKAHVESVKVLGEGVKKLTKIIEELEKGNKTKSI